MTTRFIIVKEEPKELPKGSIVIKMPDFMAELEANRQREGRSGHTAPTHLRYVIGSIGQKYDPELSAYTIRPHLYEGRKYNNYQELSAIIVEMLRTQYPAIFDKYIDFQVRNRPTNTNLIYFVGDHLDTGSFTRNGIERLDEKDLDVYLGLKPKKVVGKPAITDKEAAEQ